MEDEDEGFYAYVPNTVDPGPIVLVATMAIGLFILVTLPFAVVLGDKYEELEKRTSDNVTDSEEREEPDESKQGQGPADYPIPLKDTDDCSVSSKRSFYSTISGAVKEVIDKTGRPTHTGGHHLRHRNRHRAKIERKKLSRDQYSRDFEVNEVWDKPTQQMNTVVVPTGPEPSCSEGASLHDPKSPDGREFSDCGGHPISDCGMSDVGGIECQKLSLDGYEVPLNARNVCLTTDGFLDEIARIFAWDVEMKRIIKLSIPFVTQAAFTGMLDTLTVGVIGKLVGTPEVSAFVVANLLVELTTQFVGGFHEALATLCSQAIGNNKPRLAGKYAQIAAVLYMVAYIPFAVMWVFLLDDAITWFGFDERVVRIGTDYGYLLLVDYFVDGISESIHGLLDVAGFETYSTAIGAAEEVLAFIVILLWSILGSPSLFMIGLVQFGVGCVFMMLNIGIIWWQGWFKPYCSGLVGSCALVDKKAVWLVCRTALPLSFGYLLTDGE